MAQPNSEELHGDERASEFTHSQRDGLEIRHSDQDRTLDAMHQLEASLSTAAPGREAWWRDHVASALAILAAATSEEDDNAGQPDSILSDIKRNQPLLGSRVRGVRAQYRQLRDAIDSLRRELEVRGDDATPDYADLRQRLAWVLTALRHQRARESDLIYEAYYEAFKTELASDDPARWHSPDRAG